MFPEKLECNLSVFNLWKYRCIKRRTNKCKPKCILVNRKYSCWHVIFKRNCWEKGIYSDNEMSFLSHLLLYSPSPPEGWKQSKTFFISKKRYWQSVQFQSVLACLPPPKFNFAIPLTLHFPWSSTSSTHAHTCSVFPKEDPGARIWCGPWEA